MRWIGGWLALCSALLATAAPAEPPRLADPKDVSATELLTETMRQSRNDDSMGLVMWMPTRFWRVTAAASGSTDEKSMKELEDMLGAYVLIAVANGDLGPLGGVTWTSEEEIRKTTRLVDAKGNQIAPLAQDAVSADARNLAAMMRPVLTNIAGPIGENLHLLYFSAEGPEGAPLGDATQPGSFGVLLAGERHDFKLPLGSLLEPKRCPVDGERLSGAWRFCPHHGKELTYE
jgi:hypothetical protein